MSSIPLTFLYAIRAEGTDLVKFGVAGDIRERLKGLQTASPHRLSCIVAISAPFARDAELWLHAQLKSTHSHGEWFKIESNQQAHNLVVNAISKGIKVERVISFRPTRTKHTKRTKAPLDVSTIDQQRISHIRSLAAERNEKGEYAYGVSKIARMVGIRTSVAVAVIRDTRK